MAIGQTEKLDYLLKKIGYSNSKTGNAVDSVLSGTKKAPFAEAIPSPLTLPGGNVWAQSNEISTTPPLNTTNVVGVYTGLNSLLLTEDNTVSGKRAFIARSVPKNNTSPVLGDWIDTQFGPDYIVKVYVGNPPSAGITTQLFAGGSGNNDEWFFDYSAGVLSFSDTNVPTLVGAGNSVWLVGYRYVGEKGVLSQGDSTSLGIVTATALNVSGLTTTKFLEVSGISTFNGNIDINASVDILDDLIVNGNFVTVGITTLASSGGITTTGGDLYVGGDLYASSYNIIGGSSIGEDISTRNIFASGISTFAGITTVTGQTLFARQISVSGVVTATTFNGQINAGVGTVITLNSTNSTLTNINSSGITTVGFLTATNISASGVVTATTFIGALTGTATTATKLETPRTFEITGDVVASPIAFDGTGNVSLAATIQPDSVGLGTDTFGDYVKDIFGTSQQIVVTGGTGEGSSPTLSLPTNLVVPQDLTVTRDLQVNRNLNVDGNITIGGSTAFINVQELKVTDPDLVLGFRTDANNNDISTDNTANHGGIAIASTEGTPLIDLFIAGIETNPATYKKIMWFKEGTFASLVPVGN